MTSDCGRTCCILITTTQEALLAENPDAFSVVEPKKKVITKKSKKVPCPECGAQLPPNTLKRHVAKHKKGKEQAKATGAPVEQVTQLVE